MASACIDISDGLSTDLSHICEESRVGARIAMEAVPIHPAALKLAHARGAGSGSGALDLALHGGEDYELLFTAPRKKQVPQRVAGVKVTHIGEIVRERELRITSQGRETILRPRGWEHFRH